MVCEALLAAGEDDFASTDIYLRVKVDTLESGVRSATRDHHYPSRRCPLYVPNALIHQVPWNWGSWLHTISRFSSLTRGGRSVSSPIPMVLVLARRGGR